MFPFQQHSMTDPSNKHQFVKFLQNTQMMPQKMQVSGEDKENICLNKNINTVNHPQQQLKQIQNVNSPRKMIKQASFDNIAQTYVLDGQSLRKKYQYEDRIAFNTKRQQIKQNQMNPNISQKELMKLEYLKKMKLLKPEQEKLIEKYYEDNPHNKQSMRKKHQRFYTEMQSYTQRQSNTQRQTQQYPYGQQHNQGDKYRQISTNQYKSYNTHRG